MSPLDVKEVAVASARDAAPGRAARSWVVPVVRGALAVIPGVAVAFMQDHSPALGLLAFGVWALVSGLVVGALVLRSVTVPGTRSLFVVNAVVTVAAGLIALTVPGGLAFLLYLVSVWAAVTGFVELYAGLRGRGRTPAARDWIATGGFTVLLAIVFLLLPPDSVTAVGLLGAYLVILGVYLIIGGLSSKWAAAPDRAAAGTEQQS